MQVGDRVLVDWTVSRESFDCGPPSYHLSDIDQFKLGVVMATKFNSAKKYDSVLVYFGDEFKGHNGAGLGKEYKQGNTNNWWLPTDACSSQERREYKQVAQYYAQLIEIQENLP